MIYNLPNAPTLLTVNAQAMILNEDTHIAYLKTRLLNLLKTYYKENGSAEQLIEDYLGIRPIYDTPESCLDAIISSDEFSALLTDVSDAWDSMDINQARLYYLKQERIAASNITNSSLAYLSDFDNQEVADYQARCDAFEADTLDYILQRLSTYLDQ